MNKIIITAVVIVLLILAIFFFIPKSGNGTLTLFAGGTQATVKGHTINLSLAKTPKEREIGLSTRNDLDNDNGMLFLFDTPDYYSFWMKDMKFPIDIIFINDNKIVTIYSNVPPPSSQLVQDNLPIYQPAEPANRVLELNSGVSEKYGLKNGDQIIFKGI